MSEEIDQSGQESWQDQGQDESGVIKALRKQIKDLEAAVRAAPQRESLEAEIRAQMARESAAASLLVAKGQPATMAEWALQKIGDAEVNEDSISGFLKSQGFDVPDASEGQSQKVEVSEGMKALSEVTGISQRVSSAAGGAPADKALEDKINSATTPAELRAIMAEAGLLQS